MKKNKKKETVEDFKYRIDKYNRLHGLAQKEQVEDSTTTKHKIKKEN